MKKQFGITRLEGNYYFLLINDCEQCLGPVLNLDNLDKHTYKELTLIIIGTSSLPDINRYIEQLKNKYSVLRDSTKNIFRYSTGFSKPLLIKTKNNRVILALNIDDTKISRLSYYLAEK